MGSVNLSCGGEIKVNGPKSRTISEKGENQTVKLNGMVIELEHMRKYEITFYSYRNQFEIMAEKNNEISTLARGIIKDGVIVEVWDQ